MKKEKKNYIYIYIYNIRRVTALTLIIRRKKKKLIKFNQFLFLAVSDTTKRESERKEGRRESE
jgi:hypothetical protein